MARPIRFRGLPELPHPALHTPITPPPTTLPQTIIPHFPRPFPACKAFAISEARQPPAQPPITLQLTPFHYDCDTTPTDPPPPPPPLHWPRATHAAVLSAGPTPMTTITPPITPQPSICSLTVALHYPFTHNLLTTTMIILLSSIVLLNPILGSELTRVRDPKPGGFEAPAAAIANRKPQWPMLMDDMKRGALGGGLGQLRRSRKDDNKDDNTGCG